MPPIGIPQLPQRARHNHCPTQITAAHTTEPEVDTRQPLNPWAALCIDWTAVEQGSSADNLLSQFAESASFSPFLEAFDQLLADLETTRTMPEEAKKLIDLFQRLGFKRNAQGMWQFDRIAHTENFIKVHDTKHVLPLAIAVCNRIAERLLSSPAAASEPTRGTVAQGQFRLLLSDALEDVDKCGPGIITRLQDFLLKTAKAPEQFTVPDTVAQVRTILFEDAVTRFYVHRSRTDPQRYWQGNQVHYLSAARTILGPRFGLPGRADTHINDRLALPGAVEKDVNEGLAEWVENALAPANIAGHLAERYQNAFREIVQETQVTDTNFAQQLENIECLQTQRLLPAFGPVNTHLLLTINDDGTMQLKSDTAPLAVQLARNATREDCLPKLEGNCTLEYQTTNTVINVMECDGLAWQETVISHTGVHAASGQSSTQTPSEREPEGIDSAVIASWVKTLKSAPPASHVNTGKVPPSKQGVLAEWSQPNARPWQIDTLLHYIAGPDLPMLYDEGQTDEMRMRQVQEHNTGTRLSDAIVRYIEVFQNASGHISPALLHKLPTVLVDALALLMEPTTRDLVNLTKEARSAIDSLFIPQSDDLTPKARLALASLLIARARFASLSRLLSTAEAHQTLTGSDKADIVRHLPTSLFADVASVALQRCDAPLLDLLASRTDAKAVLDAERESGADRLSEALFEALTQPESNKMLPGLLRFMEKTAQTPLLDPRLDSDALARRMEHLLAVLPPEAHADLMRISQSILLHRLNKTGQPDYQYVGRTQTARTWNTALNSVTRKLLNHAMAGKPCAVKGLHTAHVINTDHLLGVILRMYEVGIRNQFDEGFSRMPLIFAYESGFSGTTPDVFVRWNSRRSFAAEEKTDLMRLNGASLQRLLKHPVDTWQGDERALQRQRWLFTQLVSEHGLPHLKSLLENGALTGTEAGRAIGSRHEKNLLEFAARYGCASAVQLLRAHRYT